MNKPTTAEILDAFDATMADIEKDMNDPVLLNGATDDQLQACLVMADKIYPAVSRFKMTVAGVLQSRKES